MPVELYLKMTNMLLKYYKGRKLSSNLCSDFVNAMIPICAKIEAGEYDYKKEEQ